ncbi:MAG: hypothetical protein RL324_780 [Verrucomicrobiota bacterium]|jgi:hypothetical protein
MKHYDFAPRFELLYQKALARYDQGVRQAAMLFDPAETAWLADNGISAQTLFDYAEDHTNYGEPGLGNAVAIEAVRRTYFHNVQQGRPSGVILDAATLPTKTDAVQGIAWLPRLIPKAKAKLRGELPASLMYCCGGDRAFFQQHDISPYEFLELVVRHEKDDAAIVAWVAARIAAGQ